MAACPHLLSLCAEPTTIELITTELPPVPTIFVPEEFKAPLEMVEQQVENIFEQFGITEIRFSDDTTRRKRRNVQDVLDAVADYGCWCSKPFTGTAYMGRALDEVDQICKSWSQCWRCIGMNGCTGDLEDPYALTFNVTENTYECISHSQCAEYRCECTGQLGLALASKLVEWNSTLPSSNHQVDPSVCVRGDGSTYNDQCCGTIPFWTPFNGLTHQCVGNFILPL